MGNPLKFPNPLNVPTVLPWGDAVDLLHLWAGKGSTVWAGTDGLLSQFCLPGITHFPGMPWLSSAKLAQTSPKQFRWSFLGSVLEASLVII